MSGYQPKIINQSVASGVITLTFDDGSTKTLDTGSAAALAAAQGGSTTIASSITANVITVPAVGTAPTGATALTAARNVVTTCATNGAVQLPAGASLPSSTGVMIDNRTTNGCLVYPPAGGAIGLLGTNNPATLPPGHVFTLVSVGPGTYYGFTSPHRNYIIPGITITVPAIGANQTVNITAVSGNAMVQAGDSCSLTVTSSTTLPAGLILGGVCNTGTAGQILIRAANVQTLATTAAASVTGSFSCSGS